MNRYSHPVQWSHAFWAASEPFALGMLFIPEGREALAALEVSAEGSYVALRSAPMGRAEPAVVAAAFHGFPVTMISQALNDVWTRTTPEAVIEAHHGAVPVAAVRIFGDTVDRQELQRCADLMARVCADLDVAGRPLAAGNHALVPPAEPWARLWRSCTTWREYRGDTHIAALVGADLNLAESLVVNSAWAHGHINATMLRTSRRVSDETWDRAHGALIDRGLMTPGGDLTAKGTTLRQQIEHQTDTASLRPWNAVDRTDTRFAQRFLTTLSTGMIDGGAVPSVTPVGAPWPPPPPTDQESIVESGL